MCCFTGKVQQVSGTSIFARVPSPGRQLLAYAMSVTAPAGVAMVLPLPTPRDTSARDIGFIDLSHYPEFFPRCEAAYATRDAATRGGPEAGGAGKVLEVVRVGAFEASFAPRREDLARLDATLSVPDGFLAGLPQYADHGFVVFRLVPGDHRYHPLAFSFPSTAAGLYFPTVHVHDGEVHPRAVFDHRLFCQRGGGDLRLADWEESPGLAGLIVDVDEARGLVDGQGHLYRMALSGELPNTDTWVAPA